MHFRSASIPFASLAKRRSRGRRVHSHALPTTGREVTGSGPHVTSLEHRKQLRIRGCPASDPLRGTESKTFSGSRIHLPALPILRSTLTKQLKAYRNSAFNHGELVFNPHKRSPFRAELGNKRTTLPEKRRMHPRCACSFPIPRSCRCDADYPSWSNLTVYDWWVSSCMPGTQIQTF